MADDTKYRLIAGTINMYTAEDGWVNIHIDLNARGIWHHGLHMSVSPEFVGDIAEMPQFRDETFDEIRAHHVMEHLPQSRGILAAREFHRVLKPGGILDVEVPDLDGICQAWVDERFNKRELQQWLYGEDLGAGHERGDTHQYGYCAELLDDLLTRAGFHVGERIEAGLSLRYRAVKR